MEKYLPFSFEKIFLLVFADLVHSSLNASEVVVIYEISPAEDQKVQ